MKPNTNDIFGLRRSTLLILAVAITVGSFSFYKALGCGSTKVAGTVSGKALAAGFFSCFNVVDGTVVFRTPFLVPNT